MMQSFIIIEPDPVVCMDIEGMLIDAFPVSHVSSGASLADIGAAINNCGPGTALFVRGSLVAEDDRLRAALHTAVVRKSRVVIIGQADDLDFPAIFVDLPFTTDMVIAAIAQDPSRGKATPAD